jgi:hypothetical protein
MFFRKFGGEFFSYLLKLGQPHCSHQKLNTSGELFNQWTYHCTMRLALCFYSSIVHYNDSYN